MKSIYYSKAIEKWVLLLCPECYHYLSTGQIHELFTYYEYDRDDNENGLESEDYIKPETVYLRAIRQKSSSIVLDIAKLSEFIKRK